MASERVGGNGEVARAYHEATKHSYESIRRRGHFLDWGNEPRKLLFFDGAERVDLPKDVPSLGVPAIESIATVGADRSGAPDIAGLSRILRYGAGVNRKRSYPGGEVSWFRTYASAGALYPVEVYVVCGKLEGLDAGLYHFDPLNLRLERLRGGDPRPHLVRATDGEEAVRLAPASLVLTGIPWRTAWKYTERGYRHLFWDAGMILANVLALAASAELPARAVMGFVDDELIDLLGPEDARREFPLCVVPIGLDERLEPARAAPEPATFRHFPLSGKEYVFEAITRANEAGKLRSGEVSAWRAGMAELDGAGSRDGVDGPVDGPPDALEDVIVRRGSARRFIPGSMPREAMARVLDAATRGIPTDWASRGSRLIEPYLIAHAARSLSPGACVWRDGDFAPLREGDFRGEAGYLCLEQELGADGAATHFLMADLRRVLRAGGDRAYRAAQLEGGIVAGRIVLGAYAHRFGATGLTFYDDAVTEFFSPDAEDKSCMLVTAVGESARPL